MANVANLVVKISANIGALNKSLQSAKKRVNAFGDSVVNRVGPAFNKLNTIGGQVLTSIGRKVRNVTALFVALGAAVAIKTISTINETAKSIDNLAKTSDKLGVPIEKLQALQFAAAQTGVSTQTFNTALQRQVRRIAEVSQGYGVAGQALEALGLDIKQLENLDPAQQMLVLSDAIKKVQNQAERVRITSLLFDTEGVALVNTLSSNLRGLVGEYEDLGVAVTRQQAAQVEAFNDAKSAAGFLFDSIKTKITATVAPAFKAFIHSITESVKAYGGLDKVARSAGKFIVDSAATMIESFAELPIIIGGVANALSKLASVGKSVFGFLVESAGRFSEGLADVNISAIQTSLERARSRGQDDKVKLLEEELKAAKARKSLSKEQQQAGLNLGKDLATFETKVNDSILKRVSELKAAAAAMRAESSNITNTVQNNSSVVKPVNPYLTRQSNSEVLSSPVNNTSRTFTSSAELDSFFSNGGFSSNMNTSTQPVKVENKVVIEGDLKGLFSAFINSEQFSEFADSLTGDSLEETARNFKR